MPADMITILAIEDDRVDQMALRRMFDERKNQYRYRIAGSIAEALSLLERERFDIIVTDYRLGDGTGLELFDHIANTPIIVITGGGDEETAVKALKSGAYDYLVKDLDRNYLKILPMTMDAVLERCKAEEEKRQKEKLQGVIEMAGAACHELNQPLQAISGYSELLMLEVPENTSAYDMAREIKKEVNRLAVITHKLNNITRYEIREYVEGRTIIDISKASDKLGPF